VKYPALAYHKISDQWELSFTMLYPRQFERQMRYLAEKGYRGRSLKEYMSAHSEHDFILTFDDAYESVFCNARPILNELGFHASVFVPTNYIGKENTWDFTPGNIRSKHMDRVQLKTLHDEGWEVASHGERHHAMISLGKQKAAEEMLRSKQILETLTGDKVESFCFPFGAYNMEMVRLAQDAGYKHLLGFSEASRYGVISRSPVYRVVDNRFSVLRKIRMRPLGICLETCKASAFHAFSLLTRMKQRLSDKRSR